MQHFRPEPLQDPTTQIRLLRFLPTRSQDEIEIDISTWPLSDAPAYRAISYAWGDDNTWNTWGIKVKGFRPYSQVRWNCRYALFQAKIHYPEEYIWIDSVCINQANVEEKNAQVAMMFEIYSRASGVLVSLGCHADNSEMLLNAISEDPDRSMMPGNILYVALRDFQQRPYWSRLWIVQELFASSTKTEFLCGADSFPWEVIKRCCPKPPSAYLALKGTSDDENMGRLVHGLQTIDLEDAATAFLTFSCADPRDRLYGILPLIRWSAGCESISPDYNRTGYELAMQLADSVQAITLEHVLHGFRVSHKSPEMADVVAARKRPAQAGRAVDCQLSNFEEWGLVNTSHKIYTTGSIISYLGEDGAGNLTTKLFSPYAVCRDPSQRKALHEAVPTPEWLEPVFLPDRSPKFITVADRYTGLTEALALACSETRPGDLMMELMVRDTGRYRPIFLVLRHNHDTFFDVIGQAVSITEQVHMAGTKTQFDADVQFCFTTEDKMVIVGQDLEHESTRILPKTNDSAYLQRVVTCPVLDPMCAARIIPSDMFRSQTVEEWMSSKEAYSKRPWL